MPDFTRLQQRILDRIIERDCGYDTPCWISNRAAQSNGYTKIGIDNRTHLTHRVAYEQWIGPIPDGLQVDHLCTMRACCNPDHLEAVTPRVNSLRSNSVSGIAARKTHCHRGHPLKGANLYVRPDKPTHRGCRTCRNEADQRRHAADRLRKSA